MDNYPPPMFQSSSSSTLPQNNSHSSAPPFNTAAMSSQHTPQDDQLIINPNNTYVGLVSTVENNTDADQTATMASHNNNNNIAITGSENGTKKTRRQGRYAFQTRSQVDILDDGYRWRKYGQKAVKNNKFPRSYYRCTHQGCNVKKQVQRLSKDEGIVVTTYVGMHSHAILESTDNFDHILSHMQIYTSS